MGWIKPVVGIVIALAVLGGLGEFGLRLMYPGVIESAVRSALKIPAKQEVDVSLGGSQLFSAFTGGVGNVTVEVADAPLVDGLQGDVTMSAAKVPFNPLKGEIDGAHVRLVLSDEQLDPLVQMVTKDFAQSGSVSDDKLNVGSTVHFFGQDIAVSAAVKLAASGGDVQVEPAGVEAAGFSMGAEELHNLTGALLDPVLQPQLVCVRDQLPAGVTITSIDLSTDGRAVVEADLAPGIASDPAQREPGSCG